MLYMILAEDRPDALPARVANRPEHLAHLESLGATLQAAGAMLGPDGNPMGSLVVIEAADQAEAEAIAQADPFVKHGVFGSITVRPWRVAMGSVGSK